MVLWYDKDGALIGKDYECSWSFSQKRNKEGTGKLELLTYPHGAKYVELYKGDEKIQTAVIVDHTRDGAKVNTSIRTLETLFKNYRLPANWNGWHKKPLSFILADAVYGFDYIRKSSLADFIDYIEKVNIDLNKIKDGDIHLALHKVGESLQYHEMGYITFAFDCKEAVSQRYVRWMETTGEKVYIGIQSVSSDTPIVSATDVDFSNTPVLTINRSIEHDSEISGVPIASDKRYVAVRFILKYSNADWIQDFATHKVYNENNVLVDRTVRGFTPVIRAFEIITRKKTEFTIRSSPIDMGELVDGIEFKSGGTIWDALQKIRERYPFDTMCSFEDGKLFFDFARSLVKDKKMQAEYILRANDASHNELNNTSIKALKQDVLKVNVLHCYGEGEKQQQLYVRIPEHGTYNGGAAVEEVFTDTSIKTKDELQKKGLKQLLEKRKEAAPVFEVETLIPIRLFDAVSLVHPETNDIYETVVEEEHISYKSSALTQKFGLGGFLFNPIDALIKKDKQPAIREYALQPFGLTAYGKSKSIILVWKGEEASYSIKWKKKTDAEYNIRHVQGFTTEFEAVEPNTPYLFSVAGVNGKAVSDYTAEIEAHTVQDNSLFTWIKFAKDAHGADMSDYPSDNRHWMGIAHNKLTAEESDNPADYTWINLEGKQGIAGEPGKDGKPRFIWVKYADDAKGAGMSDKPDGKAYIGFAFNKESETESDNPADYYWQKVKGEQGERGLQGLQGKDGKQGIQGIPGKDGKTSYTHIAYADRSPIIYETHELLESTGEYVAKLLCDLSAYKGKTIQVTISGYRKGEGGHPRLYIYDANWNWGWDTGSQLDSTSEATFKTTLTIPTAYNTIWCTLYHYPGDKMNNTIVMTRCSIEEMNASIGLSQNPDGKSYIGIYTDFEQTDSSNPNIYLWSLMKGLDGKNGIAGKNGADGKTSYLHIAYATSADGKQGFDIVNSEGKTYIGTYTDFIQADSTDYRKYKWSKMKGEQGIQGVPGKDGTTKFLPSLEIPGDYENQIGTFQGRLYRWTGGKWELLNAVMPLNPVAHYDMADIYNQEKIVYVIEKPISENKSSSIINAQVHEAHKKAAYYHIHCEATYTGEAIPYIYVYRSDWASSYTVLNSYVDGKQDFYFFIPEQDFDFYTGIWMQGYAGYAPKPDDSVTVYKFTVTEITNSTLIDSSGNKNHMEFVRGTTLFPKHLGTINGASFERLTYAQCKNPLNTNEWSISMWIAPECINDRYHHLFNIHNFKPFIYKYEFNSYTAKPFSKMLESGTLYHFVFTVGKNQTQAFLNTQLIGSIETTEIEIQKEELLVLGSWKYDYGSYNGFMGQVLLFDRLLTEQEVLYLCLNPQYPVKNYTLADWAIDPANPDSSIKNLTPKYLGVTETVTVNSAVLIVKGEKTGYEIANPGDWVLMGKTVGGWKVGVCYRWEGLRWEPLEPEYNYTEQYQAALYHICEIEELMQNTGHFGALFAKMLVAQKAFIDDLVARQFRIDSDPNSNQDFEAWFDRTNGLKIKNNGEEVFSVNPSGFAFMKNARFEGEIDCQGFKVINTGNTTPTLQFSWSAGDNAFTCASKISAVGSYKSLNGYYYGNPLITKHYGDGVYGGSAIRSIIYKRWHALTLSTGFVCIKLELLNNNGSLIGIISVSRNDNGYIHSNFTENDENKGWAAYRPSQYDFAFYTYNPSQTVMIPNISFGKASTPNILYRDENGFVKIS